MQFDRDAIVDTSPLNRIYPVDKESMTVKAEPNVPMDALAAHCIAVGVVPKIVMEVSSSSNSTFMVLSPWQR